jgi:hypothetical protein
MKNPIVRFAYCLSLLSISVSAQTPSSSGMQTYSPYTPGQLKEFNNQAISPLEGPFGPVAPNAQAMGVTRQPPLDSKYTIRPVGEEEAEAIETQSAQPYQATSPTLQF